MPKATAQNISLVSAADWKSVPVEQRNKVVNDAVLTTTYALLNKTVSCPKGSVITIKSNNFGGDELNEMAILTNKRDVTVISEVSFDGLISEADMLRKASIQALVDGRYELGQRYGRLLRAVEQVAEARRCVALSEYFHARVDMEEYEGCPSGLVSIQDEVIFHGRASGLTINQIEEDIAAVMATREEGRIAR